MYLVYRLDPYEIKLYCRIASALPKTIGIQEEIDILYPTVEENLLVINFAST